jgi:predicted protein tyrosine phosphatase
MKVLFVCNQNKDRSPTAEELFSDIYETSSAGLHNENPVTEKQISSADLIIVMEETQREELAKRFPKLYMQKKILCLDIPDIYEYKQPELVALLKEKMKKVISH